MALSVATIKAQIQAIKNTYPELAQILFAEEGGSIVGSFNLEADTIAECMAIQGQLFDLFQTNITAIANSAVPTTDEWAQAQILKFQYSASNPQAVQLINLVPTYAVVDPTLQVISRCSVKTLGNGIVSVKVATGTPPQALDSPTLTALKAYCAIVFGGGVVIALTTANPDLFYLNATIYYDGQYVSSIAAEVEASIQAYLAGIPFNGTVVKSDLEVAIKATLGVEDIVINAMSVRANGATFTGADVGRKWPTIAGYVIEDSGNPNTITYTAQ